MAATKPRWPQAEALRRGRTATRIAVKHAAMVDPFLSPGARDELLEARASLGDESAIRALVAQKTATAAKDDIAERLHGLLMRIREAVARTSDATEEQRAAVGIGDEIGETEAKKILAQIQSIQANRAILVPCGVIGPVVDVLVAGSITLRERVAAQTAAEDARSDTTEERIEAHLTIERLVDQISSRGALAFEVAGDPVLRDRFMRLVSAEGPTKEDELEAGIDETTTTTPTTTTTTTTTSPVGGPTGTGDPTATPPPTPAPVVTPDGDESP